jgi:hypothetical protein
MKPHPYVRADKIEPDVIGKLFDVLGNPAALERAVKKAIPNCDELVGQRERVAKELEKLSGQRKRILRREKEGILSEKDADEELKDIKGQETELLKRREILTAQLSDIVTSEQIKHTLEEVRVGDAIFLEDSQGNTYAGGNDVASFLEMCRGDRRDMHYLIQLSFGTPLSDGKPAGVYVSSAPDIGHQKFRYHIRGRLMPRVTSRVLP